MEKPMRFEQKPDDSGLAAGNSQRVENLESKKNKTTEELIAIIDNFSEDAKKIRQNINSFWKEASLNNDVSEEELQERLIELKTAKDNLTKRIIETHEQLTEDDIEMFHPIKWLKSAQHNLEMIKDIPDTEILELSEDYGGQDLDFDFRHSEKITAGEYRNKLKRVIVSIKQRNFDYELDDIDVGELYYDSPGDDLYEKPESRSSLDLEHYYLASFPHVLSVDIKPTQSYFSDEELIAQNKNSLEKVKLFINGRMNDINEVCLDYSHLEHIILSDIVDNPEMLNVYGISIKELGKLRRDYIVKKHLNFIEDLKSGNNVYLISQKIKDIKRDIETGITTYEELKTAEAELDSFIPEFERYFTS